MRQDELKDLLRRGKATIDDLVELANLLKAEGQTDEAREVYERALKLAAAPIVIARISWEVGQLIQFTEGASARVAALASESLRLLDCSGRGGREAALTRG